MGFDAPLTSTNPQDADQALLNLIDMYLDDLHTEFTLFSWMAGAQDVPDPFGPSDTLYSRQATLYNSTRKKVLGEEWQTYQEVGNTAYITFDKFWTSNSAAYYKAETWEEMPNDTLTLMMYAHSQIYRQDSPIENVVFDMSNNMGGELDAALFVMAFVLGNAELSVRDTFTGAQSTMVYRADVNLDRQFDSRDTLDDKNVYCLISPVSFSCGNLVPAAFKASQMVTLLGRTSGGGCCAVQPMSTAWGTCFQISGTDVLSFRKNGAFYDIDQGIEPDYYIDRIADFYDREKLTRFINSLSDY